MSIYRILQSGINFLPDFIDDICPRAHNAHATLHQTTQVCFSWRGSVADVLWMCFEYVLSTFDYHS